LEPDERRILGEGASPIELTAKAFDLLVLLVSKAEQLVTKDEILDAVWQEVSIAESNLTTTISMIRKAPRRIPNTGTSRLSPKGLPLRGIGIVVVEPSRDETEPADQTLPPSASDEKLRFRLPPFGPLDSPGRHGNRLRGLALPAPSASIPKTSYQRGIPS